MGVCVCVCFLCMLCLINKDNMVVSLFLLLYPGSGCHSCYLKCYTKADVTVAAFQQDVMVG